MAASRMSIRHVTEYHYATPVAASYNEARLTPLTTLSQTTVDARVAVEPAAHVSRYWDYWGTLVHAFDVHAPHASMVLTATSIVERGLTAEPPAAADVGWDALGADAVRDRYCEYLEFSSWVPLDPELAEVGAAIRASAATPRDAVGAVTDWVRRQLDYQPGSTTVSTSAVEAWRSGQGVCQDFVHLSLAVLRAAGMPSRYVSGYLHPKRDAEIGAAAVGESHAWVEAWVGDWHGVDPTNATEIAERHVLVARGRDYGDVPPVKGIYSGGAAQESTVTVELTRLA